MDELDREVSPCDFGPAMKRMAQRKQEIESVAGRRYHAYRAASDMRDVIEGLPDSPRKQELLNMANLTLRLVVLENDGGPLSPSKLNAF